MVKERVLSIRLNAETAAAIDALAAEERRRPGQLGEILIEDALRERGLLPPLRKPARGFRKG